MVQGSASKQVFVAEEEEVAVYSRSHIYRPAVRRVLRYFCGQMQVQLEQVTAHGLWRGAVVMLGQQLLEGGSFLSSFLPRVGPSQSLTSYPH